MVRTILAVIISYVVMFALTFAAYTCAHLLVGANQAFKPRSYHASNRWIAMMFAVYFVIAIAGGLICAAIAKSSKASLGLAVVVFVLGLLLAIPAVMIKKPEMVRAGSVSNMEAMQNAKQPPWVSFVFPFVGAIGVLIGGRLKRRS